MRVSKWGNSLAIRLPASVVEALALEEGDQVQVRIADDRTFIVDRDRRRDEAMKRIRAYRKPLPVGWSFDRDEATAR